MPATIRAHVRAPALVGGRGGPTDRRAGQGRGGPAATVGRPDPAASAGRAHYRRPGRDGTDRADRRAPTRGVPTSEQAAPGRPGPGPSGRPPPHLHGEERARTTPGHRDPRPRRPPPQRPPGPRVTSDPSRYRREPLAGSTRPVRTWKI